MIFNIRYDEINKRHIAVPGNERFALPKRIYGSVKKDAIRVWNDYVLNGSSGVLLTGDKGSGKSLLATILSNIAIDNGLPVYCIDGGSGSLNPLELLQTLTQCVVFIDEFGKIFYRSEQEQFLSFLSDPFNSKRLIILTENDENYVSPYILNRPGRVKYHYGYDKLPVDVFEEYCDDMDIQGKFYKDLKAKYESVSKFSFDQLKAIYDEHIKYPDEEFDVIIGYLNTSNLRKPVTYSLMEVLHTKSGINLEFEKMDSVNEETICPKHPGEERTIYVKVKVPKDLDADELKEEGFNVSMFRPDAKEDKDYITICFSYGYRNKGKFVKHGDKVKLITGNLIATFRMDK